MGLIPLVTQSAFRQQKEENQMRNWLLLTFFYVIYPFDKMQASCKFSTLSGNKPLAVAHRGASGYRPEHTLAAYQMAMDLGADFIEPDLVITKDGHLIARHEPNIIDTTDVRSRPEFAKRLTKKLVDGESTEGYFAEDFTLAEIKTLRAVQSFPFRDSSYNGIFEIPTFDEIIALVLDYEKMSGRKVGIFPETKHPTYFRKMGKPLEEKLLEALVKHKFTDPKRVFIQSFEVENLQKTLPALMKEKSLKFPLVQLLSAATHQPYDFKLAGDARTYGQLMQKSVLKNFVASYASGIGPWKDSVLAKGKATELVADAHAAGLLVIPYTFRNEERFRATGYRSVLDELKAMTALGVDGFFADSVDVVDVAVKEFCK